MWVDLLWQGDPPPDGAALRFLLVDLAGDAWEVADLPLIMQRDLASPWTTEAVIRRSYPVPIPAGATISSATWHVFAYSTTYDDAAVDIRLEKIGNSPALQEGVPTIDARTPTSASVDWDQDSLGIGYAISPDIKSCVQEVVDLSAWSGNNAMSVFTDDTSSGKTFRPYTFEGTGPAKLNVTYTISTGIVRPNADNTPLQWAPTPAGTHYTTIDEVVEQPAAGDTADFVQESTDTEVDTFDMETIADVDTVGEVTVWGYGRRAVTSALYVDIYMDGGWTAEQSLVLGEAPAYGWGSTTYYGNWAQADLDALLLKCIKSGVVGVVNLCTAYAVIGYKESEAPPPSAKGLINRFNRPSQAIWRFS